jgi:hypothetical protein
MLSHPSIRTIRFVLALFLAAGVAMKNAAAQVVDRPVIEEIRNLDTSKITPIEALNKLHKLKEKLGE